MNKKILIATHEYSGIYKNIIKDLESNNNFVFPLIYRDYTRFKIRSIKDWIIFKYDKKIKKNKQAKLHILKKYLEQDLLKKIENFPDNHFDSSFFIRADLYSIQIIKEVIRISKFNFTYHWDGMKRFPEIEERIELFDAFYVFEEDDYKKQTLKHNNIGLATNFFFIDDNKIGENFKTDIFYIGSFINNRYQELVNIYDKLLPLGLNINFMLFDHQKELLGKPHNGVKIFTKPIDYSSVQTMSKQSKIVLDLVIKGEGSHKGLSLRFFEAIQNKNKIITDNIEVLNYDFYHPNNIFIIEYDNWDRLSAFINSKHYCLPNEIINKYNFSNWFQTKVNKILNT